MNLEFIGQNVHFAVNLLASLAMFSVFWLIFDAWLERKKLIEAVKWVGFLLLAVGFIINGSVIGDVGLGKSFLTTSLPTIASVLRLLGYALIIGAQLLDPLMKRPDYVNPLDAQLANQPNKQNEPLPAPAIVSTLTAKFIFMPLLPFVAAILYWRRATTGLERHLKPVAIGFLSFAVFEGLSAVSTLQNTTNPLIYNIVQLYGPIWWTAQVILFIASIIFGNWVWRYLAKRLLSQIFIVLVTATVSIYFVSTVGFSFLLLGNSRHQALTDLTTASHVLDYAVDSNKDELKAQAETAAMRSGVPEAAAADDHAQVQAAMGTFAIDHQINSLIVTDADGKVLLRSDDPNRWGDSLSDNSLVQRALIGREAASVAVTDGVIASAVSLVSAQPIRNSGGLIVGSVVISRSISSAFVDSIKMATGLDSSVYGHDIRSATTLKTPDNLHRAVGIKETNKTVLRTVLKNGKSYSGETSYQNRAFLAAYTPLRDVNNNNVGMLLVARPASDLLATATKSTELAFLTAVGLLILSILPVYLIAKKIASDVR